MAASDKSKELPEDKRRILDTLSTSELLDYMEARSDGPVGLEPNRQRIIEQLRRKAMQLPKEADSFWGSGTSASVFFDKYDDKLRVKVAYDRHGLSSGNYDVIIQYVDGRTIELTEDTYDDDAGGWLIDNIEPKEILAVTRMRVKKDK